jgi:hypothetical protein
MAWCSARTAPFLPVKICERSSSMAAPFFPKYRRSDGRKADS